MIKLKLRDTSPMVHIPIVPEQWYRQPNENKLGRKTKTGIP
jgi:hypothetical protein